MGKEAASVGRRRDESRQMDEHNHFCAEVCARTMEGQRLDLHDINRFAIEADSASISNYYRETKMGIVENGQRSVARAV